jgi:hypothetical protein
MMNRTTLLSLATFLCLVSFLENSGAIAKSSHRTVEPVFEKPVTGSQTMEKQPAQKYRAQKGWLSKLFERPGKWFKKQKAKLLDVSARTYLIFCLGFLLAAIIFFALNGYAVIFSVFGSIAALGAAVFFVLWLLEFTGTK